MTKSQKKPKFSDPTVSPVGRLCGNTKEELLQSKPKELYMLEKAKKHFDSFTFVISYCFTNEHINPGLVLVYSCIDALAYLDRDENENEVTRKTYIRWISKFLLPNSKLKCSAQDLYGARCGLVHTATAESSLSKEGKAKMIYYAYGNAEVEPMKILLEKKKLGKNVKMVHVNDLYIALLDGIARYLKYLAKNTDKLFVFANRCDKILTNIDKSIVNNVKEDL